MPLSFTDLAKQIIALPSKYNQRLIAIDGGGGAGKTTFASHLQKAIPGSCIVKIDDFYRPPKLRKSFLSSEVINPNFDWDRLRSSVLEAVKQNKPVTYQLYDNATLAGETITIPSIATLIIEGVWSFQEKFLNYYDHRIWLEASSEVRLSRGIARDGESLRKAWEEEFIPIDEHYKERYQPQRQADYIVDSEQSDFLNDKVMLL